MIPEAGVFVGLGANLGDRDGAIARAIERLDDEARIQVVGVSSRYRTAPWGKVDQPEFLNAVAEIATDLAPLELVECLLAIERELGRQRTDATRWAPRTIDLDLLLHRDAVIDEPGCCVPHPHLHEREFALRPLLEIAPDVSIPGKGPAAKWLARLEAETRMVVA